MALAVQVQVIYICPVNDWLHSERDGLNGTKARHDSMQEEKMMCKS